MVDVALSIGKGREKGVISVRIHRDGPMDQVNWGVVRFVPTFDSCENPRLTIQIISSEVRQGLIKTLLHARVPRPPELAGYLGGDSGKV
jgi:hypothetical protein